MEDFVVQSTYCGLQQDIFGVHMYSVHKIQKIADASIGCIIVKCIQYVL